MKAKKVRIYFLPVALIAVLLLAYWFMFLPDFASGRIRAARIVQKVTPWAFCRELTVHPRRINFAISFFYLSEQRFPTWDELKSEVKDSGGQPICEQFDQKIYYYNGYEEGACTLIVEPLVDSQEIDKIFREHILSIVRSTMTEMEHEWLLTNPESYTPEYILVECVSVSSSCLQLLDIMKGEDPKQYEEIRSELLREIEEGTYERVCVFSKPFQKKLLRRKERGADIIE